MRIGELAKKAGCAVQTVRFYEKEGLMRSPRRTSANYREYGPEHAERLAFITRCRSLDMSLPEIRALLRALEGPDDDCAPVDALLDQHIEHIATRIAELMQLKDELDAIRAHCAGKRPTKDCGILTRLTKAPLRRRLARSHIDGSHGGAVSPPVDQDAG